MSPFSSRENIKIQWGVNVNERKSGYEVFIEMMKKYFIEHEKWPEKDAIRKAKKLASHYKNKLSKLR